MNSQHIVARLRQAGMTESEFQSCKDLLALVPAVRLGKVRHIRTALKNGAYDLRNKLDQALEVIRADL